MLRALHSSGMSTPKPPPHKERITITLRIPKWMKLWIESQPESRTWLIETAMRRFYKLKEPKE